MNSSFTTPASSPPRTNRSIPRTGWRRTLALGNHWIWLTGGALSVCLLMIVGLLGVVLANGLTYFWPHKLAQFDLDDGGKVLGVEVQSEDFLKPSSDPEKEPRTLRRSQFKVANRDLYGSDFRWVEHSRMTNLHYPARAIAIEREEYGDFYGFLTAVRDGATVVAQGPAAWQLLQEKLPEARRAAQERDHLRKHQVGRVSRAINRAERTAKHTRLNLPPGPERAGDLAEAQAVIAEQHQRFEDLKERIAELETQGRRYTALLQTVDGKEKAVPLNMIVRAFQPNAMSWAAKCGHYAVKVWEFVSGEPRESNTEGGIFPAIFGTVFMTLIMSVAAVPFGVLAAFYLREYAKQGPFVRAVRIAVNNLAGVPSIVFGVFGLGFFVYFLGGTLDQLFFSDKLPTPTYGTGGVLWASLTLALLTVPVVIVATEESIAAVPRGAKEGSLALGASKFQTICRVVLPASLPGILTGLILAIARGAGEVAPLMITGVVKLAPNLPLDSQFPFLHLDRKFMHLGFHIYDVGFQSPNVEAAKPMVFTTALLLLVVVGLLNLTAIYLRDKIRKKHQTGAFA